NQMLERFNDLSDLRAERALASRTRIPLALRILIYFGAVMTVASTYLFGIDSFVVHAIVAGALAGAISHVIYLISDLDQAFAGDWQVPRAPFEQVQRYMERPDGAAAAWLSANHQTAQLGPGGIGRPTRPPNTLAHPGHA